jgi:SET domain-containing protein 6
MFEAPLPTFTQHTNNFQARLFYEEEHLTMKALKSIQGGEEIFNDYGPLPRSDLLRRYGYITENYAQYDVVEVPHDLVTELATKTNIFSANRLEYLDKQGVVDTGYDISTSTPFDIQESLSPQLLILVKTLLLPDVEYERLRRKEKLPKAHSMTAKGANFLHQLVQARIQQYPTTVEEDMDTASGIPMTGNSTSKERRYAMAKSVRIGEKKILQEAEKALAQLAQEATRVNGTSKRQAEEMESGMEKRQRAR